MKAILSLVVVGLFVGCSGDDNPTSPKVAHLDLLGTTKADAIALLEDDKHNYRYCDLDEESDGCPMTADLVYGRYTVYFSDGVVVFYEIEDDGGITSFGESPF